MLSSWSVRRTLPSASACRAPKTSTRSAAGTRPFPSRFAFSDRGRAAASTCGTGRTSPAGPEGRASVRAQPAPVARGLPSRPGPRRPSSFKCGRSWPSSPRCGSAWGSCRSYVSDWKPLRPGGQRPMTSQPQRPARAESPMAGEWGDRLRRGPGAGSADGAEPTAEPMSPLPPPKGLARLRGAHNDGVRPTYGPEPEWSASSWRGNR